MKKIRRLVSVLLIALMFVSVAAPQTFAASKSKKMKTYDIIVDGNYAYCSSYKGIYRINLETGHKKTLVKLKTPYNQYVSNMRLYKGRIYYLLNPVWDYEQDDNSLLYSIKTTGKAKRKLGAVWDYAISNNKIYYSVMIRYDPLKVKNRQMKLNGKNKKKSSYKVKMTYKESNKKGYSFFKDVEDYYYDDTGDDFVLTESISEYLIIPHSDKVRLCSYTRVSYDDAE